MRGEDEVWGVFWVNNNLERLSNMFHQYCPPQLAKMRHSHHILKIMLFQVTFKVEWVNEKPMGCAHKEAKVMVEEEPKPPQKLTMVLDL